MYGGRTTRNTLRRDRIGSNGMISADNQLFSATNAYKGEVVDVFVDDTRDPAPIRQPSEPGGDVGEDYADAEQRQAGDLAP